MYYELGLIDFVKYCLIKDKNDDLSIRIGEGWKYQRKGGKEGPGKILSPMNYLIFSGRVLSVEAHCATGSGT